MSILKELTSENDLLADYDYYNYTNDEHAHWDDLINVCWPLQKQIACKEFNDGKHLSGLNLQLPELRSFNKKLLTETGWQIKKVEGLLEVKEFYRLLGEGVFPSATLLRPRNQSTFIAEPDLFHDIQGHLPIFFNPEFATFLKVAGKTAYNHISSFDNNTPELESAIRCWGAFGWFTWETGLVKEGDEIKAYGGAILSSSKEMQNVIESTPMSFVLDEVVNTGYSDAKMNNYFVIDSLSDLYQALESLKNLIA